MKERLNTGEICVRKVTTVTGRASVDEAAALMRKQHVGALVVVENSGAGGVVDAIESGRLREAAHRPERRPPKPLQPIHREPWR